MSMVVSEPPDDVCGFTLQPADIGLAGHPAFYDILDWYKSHKVSTCIREPWQDHDACIWHAEVEDKPAKALVAAWADEFERLDGCYMVDVELMGQISFAECRLLGADMSGAGLWRADLSKADLRDADLTEADLQKANLSNAYLQGADLSEAYLRDADLTEAYLRNADLSGTNLRSAAIAGVVLGNTTLSTVRLDHRTQGTPQSLRLRLKSIFGLRLGKLGFFRWKSSDAWFEHARDAHTLAMICSDKGLIRQARTFTIWERHARRYEALSSLNILTAFGSWLNWQATGYGISVTRVSRNMLILFFASTLTYLLYGIQTTEEAIPFSDLVSEPYLTEYVVDTVYFSVVTFTTSPPRPVSVGVSQAMAMVETFLGTMLIVLLGYVLGHREQI